MKLMESRSWGAGSYLSITCQCQAVEVSVGAQDWALCCGLTEEVEAHRRGKQGLSPRPSRATPLSLCTP